MCEQLGIKWCTNFKLLGLMFDQTLDYMNSNYDLDKKKVLAVANSWRNRYVSIYGKVCVAKTLMLPKLTHIATVLPTLKKSRLMKLSRYGTTTSHPKKVQHVQIKKHFMPLLHLVDWDSITSRSSGKP